MLGKTIWFNMNPLGTYNKVGTIIDGWYVGLFQVKEKESDKIYIVAPSEIHTIIQ